MKTIDVTSDSPSLRDLLKMAKSESVLIHGHEGDDYLLTVADEYESEVELLRQNHEFLAFLDERLKSDRTVSIEQVEAELGE